MDPLLKWPGGKRGELELILPAMPAGTKRIIEPFAGGAAVALAAEPKELWLNDAEPALVDFYRRIAAGHPATRRRFGELARAFTHARDVARPLGARLGARRIGTTAAARRFAREMQSVAAPWNDTVHLGRRAEAALLDKTKRLARLGERAVISSDDRAEQLATALLAAFYTVLRDDLQPRDPNARAAIWWFLREMCYGSMFRYNRQGRFNIPYGGASYNDRDLEAKAEHLASPAVRALLGRATITNLDFRALFAAYGRGRDGDWIFLDPPYDSEFSDYADRPFGRDDQRELAAIFAGLTRPALLVIKRTPFIERLYRDLARVDPQIRVRTYDHRYGYNMRGRNERRVGHLAISNYSLPDSARARRSRSR